MICSRFLRATQAASTDPDLTQESGECATISFYMNDERTVLQDLPTSAEECDGVDDIISPPSEPCVAPLITTDSDLDEPVDDGVYEVYGPPVKRPRLLTALSDPATLNLSASSAQEQTTALPISSSLMSTNPAIPPSNE